MIEAVLTGVQVVGNHFNIIASNCYITKEGFGYMLKNISGLVYEIIHELQRINSDRTSAAIVMQIKWHYAGKENERKIDFPIRMNKMMGTDAVIGKATRKARAWLYNNVSGLEVADGDAADLKEELIESKKELSQSMTSSVVDSIQKKKEMLNESQLEEKETRRRGRPSKSENEAKTNTETKDNSKLGSDTTQGEKSSYQAENSPKQEDFIIPAIQPDGERLFGDIQRLFFWLEDQGMDEKKYKDSIIELLQISEKYPTREDLCKKATVEEINRVIEKFKQLK
jgi:hypothetical protein